MDGYYHRLPNRAVLGISLVSYLLAFGYALIFPGELNIFLPLITSLIIGVLMVLVSLFIPNSLGMGDAKLIPSIVFICLVLGSQVAIAALFWLCLVSIAVSLIVVFYTKSLKTRFAFGPVLLSAPYGAVALVAMGLIT